MLTYGCSFELGYLFHLFKSIFVLLNSNQWLNWCRSTLLALSVRAVSLSGECIKSKLGVSDVINSMVGQKR